MAKMLQVVTNAYRCTVEEQDDPIVWISRAMKGAGADTDVLLRGNSVNYAIKGQDASGLSFGGREQTHPVDMAGEISGLIASGAQVYVVGCDVRERGLEGVAMVDGVKSVDRSGLAELYDGYDRVWSW
jgi:sulfur transfer complex TusBCD TusB component (DsrH family)